MSKKSHIGSSFDDFLREEGILEESEAVAIKRVIAWTIQEEMKKNSISKVEMADRMKTSRPAVDRLLDPTHTALTLNTIVKAARAIGKSVHITIEDSKAVA